MSMTWSAASMVASSCSMTSTLFPAIPQAPQRVEQARPIARVEAYRGLVEDVADSPQPGAELRREPDALRLPVDSVIAVLSSVR
jgi:hypothetical protein